MDTKSILQSKVFWGALVSLLAMFAPTVLGWFGFTIDPASQAAFVDKLVALISFGFTVYGRIVANTKVTLTGK